jgi:hypothetical protein
VEARGGIAVSLAQYIKDAPRKKKKIAKKKVEKKTAHVVTEKLVKVEVERPIAPIVKVIEHPDYSPMINEQAENVGRLAEQAIASLRDSVNNNQAVMAEIAKQIGNRPKKFIIARDARGDMTEVIPVYEGDK